jgi:hypothetical protein
MSTLQMTELVLLIIFYVGGGPGRDTLSPRRHHWLQSVAWHVRLTGFDRSEMLSSTQPAAGEAAEETFADVTVRKEDRGE